MKFNLLLFGMVATVVGIMVVTIYIQVYPYLEAIRIGLR